MLRICAYVFSYSVFGYSPFGKVIWEIGNGRRLKFGCDCLPLSGLPLRKPSEQKKQAEIRGDATPVGVEVSISRSDLAEVGITRKEKPAGKGIPDRLFFSEPIQISVDPLPVQA